MLESSPPIDGLEGERATGSQKNLERRCGGCYSTRMPEQTDPMTTPPREGATGACWTAPEFRLRVELGPRSYEIAVVSGRPDRFGAFAREALNRTWAGSSCRAALVVTDSHLAALAIPQPLAAGLSDLGIETSTVVLPPGESSKSLAQAARLFDELVARNADRHTVIVAAGGGVIGDLSGFVAATYARGVNLIMVPTTLLAQVDSSVGGKVGVNHPAAKNIIGAFHQPVGVWIDTDTLRTLPPRELRSGMAEVVKYGMILDAELFARVEATAEPILDRQDAVLRPIIAQSCRLKAGVVAQDEREETGLRATLNFGHTIGHAIEAVAGYDGPYQHGEAVAIGMAAESRIALRLGWIGPPVVERLVGLLERLRLPTRAQGLNPQRLLAAMGRDKKSQGGRVRFVLPRAIGRVELTDEARPEDVLAALEMS
jgi:3-dehydroquinate synthase